MYNLIVPRVHGQNDIHCKIVWSTGVIKYDLKVTNCHNGV